MGGSVSGSSDAEVVVHLVKAVMLKPSTSLGFFSHCQSLTRCTTVDAVLQKPCRMRMMQPLAARGSLVQVLACLRLRRKHFAGTKLAEHTPTRACVHKAHSSASALGASPFILRPPAALVSLYCRSPLTFSHVTCDTETSQTLQLEQNIAPCHCRRSDPC